MKKFQKFYLWAMYTKFYMSIYFTALMFIVVVLKVLSGDYTIHASLVLEAFIVSIITGILQSYMLGTKTDYSKDVSLCRYLIWISLSVLLIVSSTLIFKWFEGMSPIYVLVLTILVGLGFITMAIGQKIEHDMDTIKLNTDLENYKKKLERNDGYGND